MQRSSFRQCSKQTPARTQLVWTTKDELAGYEELGHVPGKGSKRREKLSCAGVGDGGLDGGGDGGDGGNGGDGGDGGDDGGDGGNGGGGDGFQSGSQSNEK